MQDSMSTYSLELYQNFALEDNAQGVLDSIKKKKESTVLIFIFFNS